MWAGVFVRTNRFLELYTYVPLEIFSCYAQKVESAEE